MTPAYDLPPLPAVQPDAAANDRFPVRLRRADLAVAHRPALALDDAKMAGRRTVVTLRSEAVSQCKN